MLNRCLDIARVWVCMKRPVHRLLALFWLGCGADSTPSEVMDVAAEEGAQAPVAPSDETSISTENGPTEIPELADIRAAVAANDFSVLNGGQNGPVLARVDGHQITVERFSLAARQWPASLAEGLTLDEKEQVLEVLLRDDLLYHEALRRELYLHEDIQRMLIEALLRQEVGSKVSARDISELEAQAYFEEHRARYEEAAQIQLQQITLVGAEAESNIHTLHAALTKAKADGSMAFSVVFRDAAKEQSKDDYALRGGNVGWLSESEEKAGVPAPLHRVAFGLGEGLLSDPIQSEQGWHIAWVKRRKEAKSLTFRQNRKAVIRDLSQEKLLAKRAEFVASLQTDDNALSDDDRLLRAAYQARLDRSMEVRSRLIALVVQEAVRDEVMAHVMTDDEGRHYYEQNRAEYGLPARVDLRLISLRKDRTTTVEGRIKEIHAQLQRAHIRPPANQSFHQVFREMAGEISQDSFARRGGDAGQVTREGKPALPSGVVERAFDLMEGELSEPFQTEQAWHIVWVKKLTEGRQFTYEQVRGQVEKAFKEERRAVLLDALVQELKSNAKIQVEQAVLEAQSVRGLSTGKSARPSRR